MTPQIAAHKTARLAEPHVAAFEAWRGAVACPHGPLPHLDPDDAGTRARLLLLMETPGPGAERLRFVSLDNLTGTARNLRGFLAEAAIARDEVALWNAVPWIVHAPGARNRPLRRGEIEAGLAMLPGVLRLFPALRVVVLAGHVARRARPVVERARPGLPVLEMPHPSPTVVCTSPAIPARIRATLAAAAQRSASARQAPDLEVLWRARNDSNVRPSDS